MFGKKKEKFTIEEYKTGLIELYEDQHRPGRPFMNMLLKEAIRKLKCNVDPKKVENWVVRVEKAWKKL